MKKPPLPKEKTVNVTGRLIWVYFSLPGLILASQVLAHAFPYTITYVRPVVINRVAAASPPPQVYIGIREISAYNPDDPNQTDDTPCIGAFGNICEMLKTQHVCATNEFPKGTRLSIGDRYECVVADRMNRRYVNGEIDIATMDVWEAKKFGRRNLEVSLIRQGGASEMEK